MRTLGSILAMVLLLMAGPVAAGRGCEEKVLPADAHARAAETAQRVFQALEQQDAPVALLSRHGTDLSKYGLHYSHMGFVVRDHAQGRWTVVHLLNECGTDDSRIYAEGLLNFFAANLSSQDVRIDWLRPQHASALLTLLQGDGSVALHDPDYNILARFDSKKMQNSTAWNLEMLAAARMPAGSPLTRDAAQTQAARDRYEPDIIHVSYGRRLIGGIASANVSFTDHPVSTRLSGDYPVVTVGSIVRYLEGIGAIERTREWRQGREIRPLSP